MKTYFEWLLRYIDYISGFPNKVLALCYLMNSERDANFDFLKQAPFLHHFLVQQSLNTYS